MPPAATTTALPILVGIVEDEPEVRRRFDDAVRAHPRLSWQFSAATVAEAIARTQQRTADVYLVDLDLACRTGKARLMRWLMR